MRKEDIIGKSVEYFHGDELAGDVFLEKYALKTSNGDILESTPDDMHHRLAKELARIEAKYINPISEEEIYNLLKNFKYLLPQGSPCFGIGNDNFLTSLSNCFVIGNSEEADSYGSIMKSDEEQVQLMKRRGGVGQDISHIRPKGALVGNAALSSAGIVPLMERYSNSTREVAQYGRRGALMLSLDIKHPDAEDFIDAKLTKGKVTGANISVKLHDDFMESIEENGDYYQTFPINGIIPVKNDPYYKIIEYNKLTPLTEHYEGSDFARYFKRVKALSIWDKIIHNAWKCLPYETEIPIYINGAFQKIQIGDLVENNIEGKKYEVPSLNLETLRIEKKLIEAYQKIKNDKKIYKLTTRSNKVVEATEDHIMYILREGKVCHIPISEILKDDYIIAADKIEGNNNVEDIINLIPGYNKKYNKNDDYILTKDFLSFIGIWYAEGNYSTNGIRLSINTNEIDDYQDIFRFISYKFDLKYKITSKGDYTDISFNSMYLKETMISLGFIYNEYNKKILPDWFFSINSSNISSFLKGIFSGDGTINKDRSISLSQSNKILIEQIQQLLLLLGIHSKIRLAEKEGTKVIRGKECNIKNGYRLTIYKDFNYIYEKYISFFIKNKVERLENHNNPSKHYLGIPVTKKQCNKLRLGWRNTVSKKTLENNPVKILDKFIYDNDIIYDRVISIEESENREFVYDITVKDNHTFTLMNGLIVSNCAEPGVLFWDKIISESPADCYGDYWKTISTNPCGEIGLCAYDSCRLLAINLYSYINNPFTDAASIDINLLKEHTRIAQRLMDDIIDLEIEKLDKIIAKVISDPEPMSAKEVEINVWTKIRDKAIRGRRTGLGVTAEGDMLAAMGLRYGTPIATDFSENIHKLIAVESYKSSIEMARERGAFPDWNYESEKNNPFINRITDAGFKIYGSDFNGNYQLYGRRNIANLTIAPTGTTSIMTQTTSGIEPVFQPFYQRRKKTEDKSKANFIDEMGDMWEEFNVFHHKFVDWFMISSGLEYKYKGALNFLMSLPEDELQKLYEASPYYKATANDVDYIEKVHMQGRIQKWVDHSISVTVNMPADVTEETVSNVYMEAWKSGCKGVTVYRDGCRSGVLLTGKEEKNDESKFKPVKAFKRPTDVPCDIHIVKSKGEPYVVMVGILDGHPYETFAFKMKAYHKIPEKGILRKHKTGWYNLVDEDKKTIYAENLALIFEIPDEENITRLVSGWLRSRGNVKYIVDILNKSKGDITTFAKVIARVLKKYIKNGELSSEKCPNCGSILVFEEGCLNCKSCGHSKCG